MAVAYELWKTLSMLLLHLSLVSWICDFKTWFSILVCILETAHVLSLSGFPGTASGKIPTYQCKRHTGSIPGLGRSPGWGHGNPLQHSCLENPMDRGAWQATVHRVAKRHDWSDLAHTHIIIKPIKELKLREKWKMTHVTSRKIKPWLHTTHSNYLIKCIRHSNIIKIFSII